MTPSSDDKPLTRRECDHCELRTEVENVKGWLSGLDKKVWALIILAIAQLAMIAFRTGGH